MANYKFYSYSTFARRALYQLESTRQSDKLLSNSSDSELSTVEKSSIGIKTELPINKFFITDLSLGVSEEASDIYIKDAVCSVSQSKTIVKTNIVGRTGSIKEYITTGDYNINIEINVLAENNETQYVDEYPMTQIRNILSLMEVNSTLYVNSEFLRLFGINRLVVESYTMQQMTFANYQTIAIKALSDHELIITSNDY